MSELISGDRRPARLGSRIKACRVALGLTQQALAERAGLSQPHVQMIEAGKRREPQLRTVARIAEALGLTIDQLLEIASQDDDLPMELERFLRTSEVAVTPEELMRLRGAADFLGFQPSLRTYRDLLEVLRRGD